MHEKLEHWFYCADDSIYVSFYASPLIHIGCIGNRIRHQTLERVGKQVEEVNFCFSSYPPAPEKQPSHGATHKLHCISLDIFCYTL